MASLDIIVQNDQNDASDQHNTTNQNLATWVMERVAAWETYRDENFKAKWQEYYRMWRGIWDKQDKSRDSERSKLISPALSQAIESTVSELEEATFGAGKWFDVSDDANDADKTDIGMFRDQMNEDFCRNGVPDAISEVFLNGAIYGTGIGKIIIEEGEEYEVVPQSIGQTEVVEMNVKAVPRVDVSLIAVHPQEFVIDPSARTIKEALGMAHITSVPRYTVEQKQAEGVYFNEELGGYSATIVGSDDYETNRDIRDVRDQDKTLLIEYHGLVPRSLLDEVVNEDEELVSLFQGAGEDQTIDETDLVEAIVTIANGDVLLRAVENPYTMKDRCFVAYQHDTVPNRFWGRGIAEKGYNPQKALDAELRGRIDAMGLTIHPMMGIDATRIPRGANFKVQPGRSIFTTGDPNQVLRPLTLGQVNNNTFSQSGELERMVQMGTGAMDSATPIGENRRNETSGGMSMIMGNAIKRSKRTLANIERTFTKPLVHKVAWRYMQFAPDRYPVVDVKFNVHSTLGIVARELEQQNLANMMKTVPADSPAFWLLLKGIFEHSTISNREEMLSIIDQMTKQALQPKEEKPDPLVQIKMQEIQVKQQIEQAKLQLEQQENNTEAQLEVAKLQIEQEKLRLKEQEIIMDAKIELAKMEQDSAVTVAQMQQKAAESIVPKNTETKEKPPVVHVHTGGNKKISVKRTENGLEGTSEEV